MAIQSSVTLAQDSDLANQATLPAGWRCTRRGQYTEGYAYGTHIKLDIDPRYLTKRAKRKRQPSQFRVELRKRYYAHQLIGDATPLGTTTSIESAREIAQQYMEAFVRDRQEVAMESRSALEADPVMAPEAEETIVTEAATGAAIEVAGYSDDLFVNEVQGLLENGASDSSILQAIIHREGREYDIAYVSQGYEGWSKGHRLREFYKQFEWLNDQKLSKTLSVGELKVMMGLFDRTRMVRYLASEDQESVILLDPEHPLHLPVFERQITDIVSAKWAS